MTILHNPAPKGLRGSDDAIILRALKSAARITFVLRVANLVYYGIILCALGWLASMALDTNPPVRILSRRLLSTVVSPGEELQVEARRIRLRQCELTRRVTIIDGIGRRFDYEPERFDAMAGPETDITVTRIPLEARPGHGRYAVVLAWDCNPLQRALGWSITVVQPTLEFEILPRSVDR